LVSEDIKTAKDGHKQHFCFLCGARDYKLPRHFKRYHEEDIEVKKMFSKPIGSKERRDILKLLYRKGDYEANLKALKDGGRNVAVVRRRKGESVNDFIPCPYCFGFFSAIHLSKHGQTCFNKSNMVSMGSILTSGRVLLSSSINNGKYQQVHGQLFSRMREDDALLIIRNDGFLLLYGAIQMETKERDQYKDIRYSLRILAKLLIELRKEHPDARANDLVQPDKFDDVVTAGKTLSGFESVRKIKNATTFLKAGFCLRKLALVVRAMALRGNLIDELSKIRNFLDLYETEWQVLATQARDCHDADKGNAPEELPLEADIKIFREFVVNNIVSILKEIESSNVYSPRIRQLAKFSLARLLTFNARRGTEVSKLKLKHWRVF